MRLILLGPPGAGKGTQCKRIIERYKVAHLSSGDILRAERAADSELGQKAQSYMDSGALVPDELIVEMMSKAIKQAPDAYILDGFPRTVNQAAELDKALAGDGESIDIVNLMLVKTSKEKPTRNFSRLGEFPLHIDITSPASNTAQQGGHFQVVILKIFTRFSRTRCHMFTG